MNTAVAAPAVATETGAIAVRGVSKWFKTADGSPLQVLADINLTIPVRTIVAILGASGCGKSTLLNIISGLVTPEQGEVLINGTPSGKFSDWRSVSYMFQEDRLLPWRTALHNVEFALEAGAMLRSERQTRAREALRLVGLEAFADAFPYQLSGGMRSRVALARSLGPRGYLRQSSAWTGATGRVLRWTSTPSRILFSRGMIRHSPHQQSL